jgi:hypothetical protein
MSIVSRKLVSRGLRKRLGLVFWIVSGSAVFVLCGRMLWLAYTSHWVFMPLRRVGGRRVLLEQEPGFFWTAVAVYAIVFLCGPIAIATSIGDLIGQVRARRRRLRQERL